MRETDARAALVDAAVRLDRAGLNHNSSGNLSVRVDDHILVTPSGIPAHVMSPSDTVLLRLDGAVVHEHSAVPTSEWRLHAAIMRNRPEVGAVVHTHSPEATAAAIVARPIPAVHYVVARFGASMLPCSPYATYGSDQLADHVVNTLAPTTTACLMANHGAVALGADLSAAVATALEIEWFCGVHRRAVQLGDPVVLDDREIARVAEMLARYGQPGNSAHG